MSDATPLLDRVIKDGAIYGAATLLARGVHVLLIPVYTRILSPSEFGISDVLLTLIALVDIVISLEISQALMRFFPDARVGPDKDALVSSSFWFIALGHLLVVACLAPFSTQISQMLFGTIEYSLSVLVTIITVFFYGLYNLTTMVLRARLQALHFSISSFAFAAVSSLGTILFVIVFNLAVTGILLGNLIGYLIAAGLALYYARGNYTRSVNFPELRSLLRFSAPLVPSSLGYFLTFYMNRFALNFLLTAGDVGLYAVAYRLASPVNMVMNSLSSSLTPLIYSHYRSEKTPAALAQIFRLVTAGCLMIILLLSVFANEVLRLMTTAEYYSAVNIIPYIAVSAALAGFYIFTPGLFITNETWLISAINVGTGILNIGLNFVLIPMLGLTGAALATCLAMLVNLAVTMVFSQKRYFIPVPWRRILLGSIISICVIVGGLSFKSVGWNIVILKIALLSFAAMGFMLVKLVEKSEVIGFLNYLGRESRSFLKGVR